MRCRAPFAFAVLAMLATLQGCVTKDKYEAALKDASQAKADRDQLRTDAERKIAADDAQVASLKAQIDQLARDLQDREGKLKDGSIASHDLQQKLDEQTAINQQVRGELERLGKNVDKLLADKGALARSLDDARARLEELRKAQAAAEARAALWKQLVDKFRKLIDAGELKIVMRDGRMVLQLPTDVLFDSGRVDVKPAGQQALVQVAGVLKTLGGRKLQVAGHTDNVPIQTARFPSNWELSTQRAIEVARVLIAQGVRPEVVSAAGYGEFEPVAPNDAPDARARNRRIEITLRGDGS